MKIVGIEGMAPDRLQFELQRGARLVCYQYSISLLVITFRRSRVENDFPHAGIAAGSTR